LGVSFVRLAKYRFPPVVGKIFLAGEIILPARKLVFLAAVFFLPAKKIFPLPLSAGESPSTKPRDGFHSG